MEKAAGIKAITLTAAAAAIICVLAPWKIPIGPIPITLATFAIYLISALLGAARSAAAVAVYILLGAVGVPVFSGFIGGFNVVAGVTGGYIIGYLPCAFIIGLACSKFKRVFAIPVSMLAGTFVLYAVGTAWYCIAAGVGIVPALSACVLPFIAFDGLKIAAASFLAIRIRPVLSKLR